MSCQMPASGQILYCLIKYSTTIPRPGQMLYSCCIPPMRSALQGGPASHAHALLSFSNKAGQECLQNSCLRHYRYHDDYCDLPCPCRSHRHPHRHCGTRMQQCIRHAHAAVTRMHGTRMQQCIRTHWQARDPDETPVPPPSGCSNQWRESRSYRGQPTSRGRHDDFYDLPVASISLRSIVQCLPM
jgi:hypothetical protein